jgi:L-ascorbate metabolism protein UlaG (beta-lactamase superfamily)
MKKTRCTVTWLGHSAFHILSPSGKGVLIDPWLTNPNAPADAIRITPVDLILVSHGHSDHLGETMAIAQRSGAKVLSIFEVCLYLRAHGVPSAEGLNKGGSISVDGITVTMIDAVHSSGIDVGESVTAGGEAAGFVVKLENGYTLYHCGDTALFGDMKLVRRLYRPDLMMVPIGGLYTMGPVEAAVACTFVNPHRIIGMHYGTFPVLSGTPAMLRKHLPAKLRAKVVELTPGKAVAL